MELFSLAGNILLVSVQTRIEADGKGRPFEDGLRSEGEKYLLGGTYSFLLEYQNILFCVSEILGQGCQMAKSRRIIFINPSTL